MRTTPTRSILPAPATRTSSTRPESGALARCVEPLSAEEFLADWWEDRPLVVERGGKARFDDLLSVADLERLVTRGALRHPAFRLVKAGERISVRDYTVDVPWRPEAFAKTLDVERVAAAFADGATIVVQGLHHWWHPLAVFCRALEAELDEPVQANAYYTPRDSQGLPVHHDTHDVFVLQLAGEKRWLVYEPAWELPLKEQRYSSEMGAPGEPLHDVVLGPGDTLYLPRGWLHEAVTSVTDSLHLTVGVNVYTWADAVRAALTECEDEVAFRRSIPADGEGGDALLGFLAERLDPGDVARRRRERFVRTRRPILDDQLAQLRGAAELRLDTPVERRSTVLADLRREGDGVVLLFEGKELTFPARARDAIEHLVGAADHVTPSELPGDLDGEGRLVLVRRLVREGFLRIAATPSPGRDGSPRRSDADAVESPRRT
ncbi:MAG TPA: cupin domain-containing protein [Gaiellaceae bacterium]|nr:cupin domain-containing protein [Gaiellaceae bacterium]